MMLNMFFFSLKFNIVEKKESNLQVALTRCADTFYNPHTPFKKNIWG